MGLFERRIKLTGDMKQDAKALTRMIVSALERDRLATTPYVTELLGIARTRLNDVNRKTAERHLSGGYTMGELMKHQEEKRRERYAKDHLQEDRGHYGGRGAAHADGRGRAGESGR